MTKRKNSLSKDASKENIMASHLSPEETFTKGTTREEVLAIMKQDKEVYEEFLTFPSSYQEEVMLFFEGAKGLKITYNPFFLKIFDPYTNLERLEFFLQTILKQPLKILEILSREGMQLMERGSLVIMDILVALDDGSMVNVEMQKVGYAFPAERSECYASDMTMRQYTLVKNQKGKAFTFKDLKPIFIIVIMETSPNAFETSRGDYIHKRIVSYDTGICLNSLHNIMYINLDIFRKNVHTISDDIQAWLTFLSSDEPADIMKLIEYHPIFKEMYHDMVEFRKDVKEVVHMYSEALKIMDHNTELYMIEEMQKELEKKDEELEENMKRIAQLEAEIKALKSSK